MDDVEAGSVQKPQDVIPPRKKLRACLSFKNLGLHGNQAKERTIVATAIVPHHPSPKVLIVQSILTSTHRLKFEFFYGWVSWPNGKALDFGSKDCAFESHRDRFLL
jgi:hypothetical protein